MFDKFLRLGLPTLCNVQGKDADDFLITCKDKHNKLCLVETCGVDYTTSQLDLAAQ